jgi:hypothetical protein
MSPIYCRGEMGLVDGGRTWPPILFVVLLRLAGNVELGHRFGHENVWNVLDRGKPRGRAGSKVAGQGDRSTRAPTARTVPVNLRG